MIVQFCLILLVIDDNAIRNLRDALFVEKIIIVVMDYFFLLFFLFYLLKRHCVL